MQVSQRESFQAGGKEGRRKKTKRRGFRSYNAPQVAVLCVFPILLLPGLNPVDSAIGTITDTRFISVK